MVVVGAPLLFVIGLVLSNEHHLTKPSRRDVVLICARTFAAASAFGRGPHSAIALDVRAPLECLYPAIRVRLYIDDAVQAAIDGSLDDLRNLLVTDPPSSFVWSKKETASADQYLRVKTQEGWNRARRLEIEERGALVGIDYATPYDKANTAIQEMGRKQQFQILRKRQVQLEKKDPIRAALNAYTNNLIFGDSYQLNAQGIDRKQMIRNDALPDVNSVVVSDLDLRDLYRNQILQNMEDARFELDFQLRQSQADIQEVLVYLKEAQKSCDSWFSFIPQRDVGEALAVVKAQQ